MKRQFLSIIISVLFIIPVTYADEVNRIREGISIIENAIEFLNTPEIQESGRVSNNPDYTSLREMRSFFYYVRILTESYSSSDFEHYTYYIKDESLLPSLLDKLIDYHHIISNINTEVVAYGDQKYFINLDEIKMIIIGIYCERRYSDHDDVIILDEHREWVLELLNQDADHLSNVIRNYEEAAGRREDGLRSRLLRKRLLIDYIQKYEYKQATN